MARRAVKWTRTADIQFVGILEYWAKRNKSKAYSKKLIHLVQEISGLIAETPFLFPESGFKNTRFVALGNFSLFYQVREKEIIVTAFWDNRQDPKKLLKILKKSL